MSETAQELEKKLQHQIDQINEAITKTRNNELVDISHMDEEIADLCKTIIGAEENIAKELESKMIEMINILDSLAEELQDYQQRNDEE